MSSKRPGTLKVIGLILLVSASMEAVLVCIIWVNPSWRKVAADWVTNPNRETKKVVKSVDKTHWDEKLFDFNVSNFPDTPEVYFQRAQFRSLKKKYKEAIEDCDQALALADRADSDGAGIPIAAKRLSRNTLARIYAERAEAKMHLRQLPEAAADFQTSLKFAPAHTQLYALQTDCYLRMNDVKKAIDISTQGIKYYPRAATLYAWRAAAYDRNKEPELAVNDINRAIELEPDTASYFVQKCSIMAGRDDKLALVAVNKAIDLDPDRTTAYDWKICILLRQKKFDEALAAADKGLDQQPQSGRLKELRENILAEEKSHKEKHPLSTTPSSQ